MNKKIWNAAFIFGLVFAVIGVLMLFNLFRLKLQCTEKTNGLIVEGDIFNKEAAVMLTFTVNGENYRLPTSYSDKMTGGLAVTVFYNPSKIGGYSLYILEDVPNTVRMAVICIIAGIIAMLLGYGVSIGLFRPVWRF